MGFVIWDPARELRVDHLVEKPPPQGGGTSAAYAQHGPCFSWMRSAGYAAPHATQGAPPTIRVPQAPSNAQRSAP